MDVQALYQSTKSKMPSQAIKESIRISNLKWKNVNIQYLARYISLTVERKVIDDAGLSEVVPIPKPTTTLNSFRNSSSGSTAKATNGDSQFIPPLKI